MMKLFKKYNKGSREVIVILCLIVLFGIGRKYFLWLGDAIFICLFYGKEAFDEGLRVTHSPLRLSTGESIRDYGTVLLIIYSFIVVCLLIPLRLLITPDIFKSKNEKINSKKHESDTITPNVKHGK